MIKVIEKVNHIILPVSDVDRVHNELPACYFPPEVEKIYDRSIRKLVAIQRR